MLFDYLEVNARKCICDYLNSYINDDKVEEHCFIPYGSGICFRNKDDKYRVCNLLHELNEHGSCRKTMNKIVGDLACITFGVYGFRTRISKTITACTDGVMIYATHMDVVITFDVYFKSDDFVNIYFGKPNGGKIRREHVNVLDTFVYLPRILKDGKLGEFDKFHKAIAKQEYNMCYHYWLTKQVVLNNLVPDIMSGVVYVLRGLYSVA